MCVVVACCACLVLNMESEDLDLPMSQKTFGNSFDCENGVVSSFENASGVEGDFDYVSQVCETSNFSLSSTPSLDNESRFVSQSATIPLVPYDDKDEPHTDEETPNFFFGLLDDSMSDKVPPPSQAVPATQTDDDAEWLRSNGIDFDPEEW